MSDLNFSVLPACCDLCHSPKIKLHVYKLDKVKEGENTSYYFSQPITGSCEACGAPYKNRGIKVSVANNDPKEVEIEVKKEIEVVPQKEVKVKNKKPAVLKEVRLKDKKLPKRGLKNVG